MKKVFKLDDVVKQLVIASVLVLGSIPVEAQKWSLPKKYDVFGRDIKLTWVVPETKNFDIFTGKFVTTGNRVNAVRNLETTFKELGSTGKLDYLDMSTWKFPKPTLNLQIWRLLLVPDVQPQQRDSSIEAKLKACLVQDPPSDFCKNLIKQHGPGSQLP